mmetsp:Transcript_29926/g.61169  ORF Transcript_29926/g.61169 Transcript_29926/m.61169 type:complete len:142 (+) Transcript_29926:32-457(+)
MTEKPGRSLSPNYRKSQQELIAEERPKHVLARVPHSTHSTFPKIKSAKGSAEDMDDAKPSKSGRREKGTDDRGSLDRPPAEVEASTVSFDTTSSDEKNAYDSASQMCALVMFALWMALLVAMGVWMLRLIPNTGGFPAGES